MKLVEDLPLTDETNYVIKCTCPHPRIKNQDYHTPNYIKCNNHLFIVRWYPKLSQAKIFCSVCREELTTFMGYKIDTTLEMQEVGGTQNADTNLAVNSNDSGDNSAGRNDTVGNPDTEETNKIN